jgi:excisionase family DNA binding protein
MKQFQAEAPTTDVTAATASPPIRLPQHATLLSINGVCLALQCGRTFVYELLQKGEMRPIKLGRLTRISQAELNAFLAAKEADAADRFGKAFTANTSVRELGRPRVTARERRAVLPRRSDRTASTMTAVEQPCLLDVEHSRYV